MATKKQLEALKKARAAKNNKTAKKSTRKTSKKPTVADRANAFNPYKIYWMALVPVKGKTTKTDLKKLNKIVGKMYFSNVNVCFTSHFPNKEKAIAALKLIKKADVKQYKAYLFTDKQFGMADKNGNIPISPSHSVKLTEKQLKSVVIIGKAPAKKALSGTGKNGMEYYYLVNNKQYPTLKLANSKVATYKIAPKVFKIENYPNAAKPSKRTIKVKGQPGRYTIL